MAKLTLSRLGSVLKLVLVLVVLQLVCELVLVHLVLESSNKVGRLLGICAQVLVMTLLVSTIVRSVERIGVVKRLVILTRALCIHIAVESTSDVGRLLRICTQVLVMTWLVSTVVGSVERICVVKRWVVKLACRLTLAILVLRTLLTIERLNHTCWLEATTRTAVLRDHLVRSTCVISRLLRVRS